LHRVSGVIMFFSLPLVLYFWEKSLYDADFYAACASFLGAPVIKIIYIILLWALTHHLLAGIRFLLLDLHYGIGRKPAQFSAKLVIILSVVLSGILGILIW
jgi:succinate dehydrogenase / fumarate reductase cytochrome b subunit